MRLLIVNKRVACVLAGLVVAMGSGSVLSSLALGVSPRAPVILALLAAGVIAIAVASCSGLRQG